MRDKIIKEHFDKYAREPVEHMSGYKDGVLIAESEGTTEHCDFNHPLKDLDLVHNHPNDSPCFSPQDVFLTIEGDANSITADSATRGSWTLVRPEGGWMNKETMSKMSFPARSAIKDAFDKYRDEELQSAYGMDIMDKMNNGDISWEEANQEFNEHWISKALPSLGLRIEKRAPEGVHPGVKIQPFGGRTYAHTQAGLENELINLGVLPPKVK
jgi:hypothetical protein